MSVVKRQAEGEDVHEQDQTQRDEAFFDVFCRTHGSFDPLLLLSDHRLQLPQVVLALLPHCDCQISAAVENRVEA